ncbi:hypothetical protein TRICI_002137 [Trichomonascus ciferrii]|uniref:Xylanolytic transcriptional activator regulatory domain-containing protein n=1 Tax=Trichomonascus ciferrii TaxID=44093 RepID=A0A642V7A7_9ASCO|nr:hypothetical protein TRICI_002137 [Trichomonascus ciferrii]
MFAWTAMRRLSDLERGLNEHAELLQRILGNGIGNGRSEESQVVDTTLQGGGDGESPALPPESVLRELVYTYFDVVHPWVPVLHRRRFELGAFEEIETRSDATVLLLHAIVAVTIRFCKSSQLMGLSERRNVISRCRKYVLLKAMETRTLESAEALIILSFDQIGSGSPPEKWPIIDTLTKMVERLGLQFEPLDNTVHDYIREEEKRRIYWIVFSLDRLSSMLASWKPLLQETYRRLPCGGTFYKLEKVVRTRYFAINNMPFPDHNPDDEEIAAIGGLAYGIEATELLNLTIQCLNNHQDSPSVHNIQQKLLTWKQKLPSEWQVPRPRTAHRQTPTLDENLVLAHVTYNTCLILLDKQEEDQETSAKRITAIMHQYLSINYGLVHPQLAYCLFLVGSRLASTSKTRLEFYSYLQQLSDRWHLIDDHEDLAAKLSKALQNNLSQIYTST